MTSVDSSKDRIIIPDQAQRRSNLDEVKVQRPGLVHPEHVFVLSYTHIHTHTHIYLYTERERGWGKWRKSLWEMTMYSRGGSRSRGRGGGGGEREKWRGDSRKKGIEREGGGSAVCTSRRRFVFALP